MNEKYVLGYLDEDEGQVKKFKRIFKKHGFDVIGYTFRKGMTLEELMKQVYASKIDLLMIDYRLMETNVVNFEGDQVERHIFNHMPLFPHIIFTNGTEQAIPKVDDSRIVMGKDVFENLGNTEKIGAFIDILKKSIGQYRRYVAGKKLVINTLLETSTTRALNTNELDELYSAQRDLRTLNSGIPNEIPEHFIEQNELANAENLRQEVALFLEQIKTKG